MAARSLPSRLFAVAVVALLFAAWRERTFGATVSGRALSPKPRFRSRRGLERDTKVLRRCSSSEDEVRWLEPLSSMPHKVKSSGGDVLPLFPLGGVFLPHTEHQLSIFEPRYRKLYNDILVSGSRRFVVPLMGEDQRLAEVGVVMYLTDLQDVSEDTDDNVKYVCDHKVIGRVRLTKVLNPRDWEDASDYLRAEVEPLEDTDDPSEDTSKEEAEVIQQVAKLTKLDEEFGYESYEEGVEVEEDEYIYMNERDSLDDLNASRAEEGGLWYIASILVEYFDSKVSERETVLSTELEEIYWKEESSKARSEMTGFRNEDFDSDPLDDGYGMTPEEYEEMYDADSDSEDEYEELHYPDLSPAVFDQITRLQTQYEEEEMMFNSELETTVQLLLQATSHRRRLEVLRRAFAAEVSRLATRKAIMSAVRDETKSVGLT